MRIAVLDDYQHVAHRFADWSRLGEHELTFFHEPLDDVGAGLEPFEIVCAMRERTAFPAELFDRLPNLQLLVTTGRRNASIDMEAGRRRSGSISPAGRSASSASAGSARSSRATAPRSGCGSSPGART